MSDPTKKSKFTYSQAKVDSSAYSVSAYDFAYDEMRLQNEAESLERIRQELAEAKLRAASVIQPMNAAQAQRKLQAGEVSRTVDQGGYWLHFVLDDNGIPTNPRFLLMNAEMTEWFYTEDKQVRIAERLPKLGLFIFLY